MKLDRLVANQVTAALSIYAETVTASATGRTLSGDIVRFGVPGRTSAGRLVVDPGALRFPEPLSRVKLTLEHDRAQSRGHLVSIAETETGIRASLRVADGPLGDAALSEAADHTRDGFSFDVVDATIRDGHITSALVIAVGQVGIPAYDDTRIDQIAASQTPATPVNPGGPMTPEQRARLEALRAQATRTAEEETELGELEALATAHPETAPPATPAAPAATSPTSGAPAAGGVPVAASLSAVPPGVPTPGVQVTSRGRDGGALEQFLADVTAAYQNGDRALAVTAALNDITYGAHGGIIAQPAWSGELWSGVDQQPEFTNLFNQGSMFGLSGEGWRFVTKPQISDYAGNKAAIPSTTMTTERSTWTGARMAVGNDFDRAFYDFPNTELLRSYAEFVRRDWVLKLDAKVLAYILANVVPAAGVDPQPTLFKAVSKVIRTLKRRQVGKATFILVNDDDYDTLMDISSHDVPAYLQLFGIDPERFISSASVPQGSVIGGVKQAATVRTLPGSPIRADAQHIANGGIDTAFFGYWAIEEHHTSGIASVEFEAPVEEETP